MAPAPAGVQAGQVASVRIEDRVTVEDLGAGGEEAEEEEAPARGAAARAARAPRGVTAATGGTTAPVALAAGRGASLVIKE